MNNQKQLDLTWNRFYWFVGPVLILTLLVVSVNLSSSSESNGWQAIIFFILSNLFYFTFGWRRAQRKFGLISSLPTDISALTRELLGPPPLFALWFILTLAAVFAIAILPLLLADNAAQQGAPFDAHSAVLHSRK